MIKLQTTVELTTIVRGSETLNFPSSPIRLVQGLPKLIASSEHGKAINGLVVPFHYERREVDSETGAEKWLRIGIFGTQDLLDKSKADYLSSTARGIDPTVKDEEWFDQTNDLFVLGGKLSMVTTLGVQFNEIEVFIPEPIPTDQLEIE